MDPMMFAAFALGVLIVGGILAGPDPGGRRPGGGHAFMPKPKKTPRARLLISGSITICKDVLRIGSVRVAMGGTVHLGLAAAGAGGGIHATAANVVFDRGATLKIAGDAGRVILSKKRNALAFLPGAVLDLSDQVLAVGGGRLLLEGTCRFGVMARDESMLLTFVSVNEGDGVAVLGDSFRVELTDRVLAAYADNPEDAIEEAVVVDAVVSHTRLPDGAVWEQVIHSRRGRFSLTARLGAAVTAGGGLRVSFCGVKA